MNILGKIIKSLSVLFILVLFSCSSNQKPKESASNDLLLADETSTTYDDSPALGNKNTNETVDEYVPANDKIPYNEIKRKYKVSASTVDIISAGLINVYGVSLDQNLSDLKKQGNVIINAIGRNEDSKYYIDNFLPKSIVLANSKFQSKTPIDPQEISGFAQYIGANAVLIKGYLEEKLKKYLYEIDFIETDITKGYWNTKAKDYESLKTTLSKLRITNLNSFLNITTPLSKKDKVLEEKSKKIEPKVEFVLSTETTDTSTENENEKVNNDENTKDKPDQPADTSNKETDTSKEEPILTYQPIAAIDTADNKDLATPAPQILTPKIVFDNAKEENKINNDYNFQEDIMTLQRKLISFKIDTVVGFWVDINTNDLYEILQSEEPSKENKFVPEYSGFIILKDNKSIMQTVNKFAPWESEDLVFRFKKDSSKGFYINQNKLISNAYISLFKSKGIMEIKLNSGRTIYLAPMIVDIKNKLFNNLYQSLRIYNSNTIPDREKQNMFPSLFASLDKNMLIEDFYKKNKQFYKKDFTIGSLSVVGGLAALLIVPLFYN